VSGLQGLRKGVARERAADGASFRRDDKALGLAVPLSYTLTNNNCVVLQYSVKLCLKIDKIRENSYNSHTWSLSSYCYLKAIVIK